jgi:hypothetical protein
MVHSNLRNSFPPRVLGRRLARPSPYRCGARLAERMRLAGAW